MQYLPICANSPYLNKILQTFSHISIVVLATLGTFFTKRVTYAELL